ncbi:hypothetical protein SHKM778_13400 [Streptomyces sp. KM77-8]|uniref:Isoprenyl transferase n=1 Tax=Streptomyces haneummycinicus TaxID=3074435 RepID=A0AAT9HCK8_9ACTN
MNLRDKLRGLLVRLYARRVEGHLDTAQVPGHIGVIMDGNRRWAKASGSSTVHGHRVGADKIGEFLGWCSETDVEVVTLWLLSTDNFDRPKDELVPSSASSRTWSAPSPPTGAGGSTTSAPAICCPRECRPPSKRPSRPPRTSKG